MRVAFSALELVLAIVLGGILFGFSIPKINVSLHNASVSLLSHIRYTQHLALNDSLEFANLAQTSFLTKIHPSIDAQKLLESEKNFWQIQFHQSGIYTLNSYSIFFDTPRFSPTTDRDNQPQPGDIIAINGANRRCLSGYSNVNISIECRNNSQISVRLFEYFGIESIVLEGEKTCQEMGTFRIYFDKFGTPRCARDAHKITQPMRIILTKNKSHTSICVLPKTGYAFIAKDNQC